MDLIHLTHQSDKDIITKTKALVLQEAQCAFKIISYLAENRKRKIYAALGYANLFEYCVKELGFSHAETQRRLSSAKLLDSVPEAGSLLAQGKLSLTTLSQIQTHINHQEKETGKRFSVADQREIVHLMQGKSTREVEKELLKEQEKRGLSKVPQRPQAQQVGCREVRFHVTLTSETYALLTKAKSYFTKTKVMSWDELLNKLAQDFIEKQFPKIKKASQALATGKVTRYVPLAVREQLWQRSRGMCEFVSPLNGKHCESSHRLQFAHIKAYSKGGKTDLDNMKLLCAEHNAYEAALEFPQQYNAAVLTARKLELAPQKRE